MTGTEKPAETFTRGDKVLLPRGRKPYTVMSVNEDGTLNLRRPTPERAYQATARSYRGIGGDRADRQWSIDPATVTRWTA